MTGLMGTAALLELLVVGVLVVRLAAGPTVSDRIVALNAISTQITLSLVCLAIWADRSLYLDVGLWLGSFSYLGTLLWARVLERGLL
jgi:multicomponent Na+:H+ antiporter subunit F